MRMYDIINKKRLGENLSDAEIEYFVRGYTEGSIPDYQASALCMAIMLNGMNDEEISALTMAMAESGDMADLSMFGDLSVDKHSTGGVGDKTTLIVAPIVASLGAKVAKMSGRGLGHTGGTVDKLESIPDFKTTLTVKEFIEQVQNIGIAVIGQSGNFAPCDKKLYALRDVTATVQSIPLITSSIMSKKIAAGSRSIVLDIKVGDGAFMKSLSEAEELGRKMVDIGKKCNRNIAAVITDMNIPLGYAIGNALEVEEAIAVLKGEKIDDLRCVCEELASNMISLSLGLSYEESKKRVAEAIDSGLALLKFNEWITAQGGDMGSFNSEAPYSYELKADCDGYISSMNAEIIGTSSVILGAGRENKDDVIDMQAGIVLKRKTGDEVKTGETVAVLYSSDESKISKAAEIFSSALTYSKSPVKKSPLIYSVIK